MIGENSLNLCFEKLMVFGGGNCNNGKMGGAAGTEITEWKDIPVELLLGIVSLVDDDRIMILASGVCSGWRDAISCGLIHLNLSWYDSLLKIRFWGKYIYIFYGFNVF